MYLIQVVEEVEEPKPEANPGGGLVKGSYVPPHMRNANVAPSPLPRGPGNYIFVWINAIYIKIWHKLTSILIHL